MTPPTVAVIGAGPAGLAAAEAISGDVRVAVFDAMPSVGRKFLLAGKGGLNLTHGEPFERFRQRYHQRSAELRSALAAFGPDELRRWADGLGAASFVGSSGRVFPADKKAAPLLRAWVRRLRQRGVVFHTRHRWRGWRGEQMLFDTPGGSHAARADALVLALGGGSWPRLGSDGAWLPLLAARGIEVRPLRPANCGFDCDWSESFATRFAGAPVKTVSARVGDGPPRRGEFVVTAGGIEGSLVYTLSAALRDALETRGSAGLQLDLCPDRSHERLCRELARPRRKRSLVEHWRRTVNLAGVRAGLLRELAPPEALADAAACAAAIKRLALPVRAPRPLAEAISSAGGVAFEALDGNHMCRRLPGVFCAGEMLDWEAPTGGYLLTGCIASGRAAGRGVLDWLARTQLSARPPTR